MPSTVSRRTGRPHWRQWTVPIRANRTRRKSKISVTVATVERGFLAAPFCWMAIAGGMPSIDSASGLSIRSRNWRA